MFRVLAALPNLSTSTEVWTITEVWTGKHEKTEPQLRPHIGQVDSGVEQMAGIGDTDVKFEIIND